MARWPAQGCRTDGGHPVGSGLFHLALAQLELLLEVLLLAFGLLQAGVFLGVDLGKTGQLLPQAAQLSIRVRPMAQGPQPQRGQGLLPSCHE